MRPLPRNLAGLLVVVSGLVHLPNAAAAQQQLPGRALDADDRPVAGLEIMLHRVTPEGGALVARDTSADDGSFLLSAAEVATDDPVYFVAARYDGQLQIGPMLRAPFPQSGYVLRVGAPAGPALPDARKAALVVAGLALLGLLAVGVLRPTPRRRLLLRLAQIEEARAAGEQGSRLDHERARIWSRLRHGAGS